VTLTRRSFVVGTAAAAVAACTRPPVKWAPVTIARASSYSAELHDLIRRILIEHRVEARGKRVVLKPNLVEFEDNSVINTNPALVFAAREAFLSLGAAEVRIAEGPGHRRVTLDLADAAGFFSTIPKFESIFTDLNLDDATKVNLVRPQSKLSSLYLPHTVLGCDLLVSMPKMKTHHWAGATLSMKNLFGLVPGGIYGWPKNILHWAGIDECIADLHQLFPRAFTIVDGIVGMEGNGPIQGIAKNLGVVVAGADPVAVDATCCRLMRIDPVRVRYLKLAGGENNLTEGSIPQRGETIASVAAPFALLPQLQSLRLRNNAG
jgi:uncharacterized protein (DUF362 family)